MSRLFLSNTRLLLEGNTRMKRLRNIATKFNMWKEENELWFILIVFIITCLIILHPVFIIPAGLLLLSAFMG